MVEKKINLAKHKKLKMQSRGDRISLRSHQTTLSCANLVQADKTKTPTD